MNRVRVFFVCGCTLVFLLLGDALATTVVSGTAGSRLSRRGVQIARQAAPSDEEHEYYVDCSSDVSKGNGHSPAMPWTSVAEVNAHTFAPGDTIYFKRESSCSGLLSPKGSGSASAAIRISAYGYGKRPRIVAGMNDEEAFKLFDQEYWEVDSLEFSGGKIFGVFISGSKGILHHIHLRNLLVHDVYGGEVKHKESGLVVISPGKAEQRFDEVLVEGITAYGTDQWSGILVGGGNFGFISDADWNTHVIVRDCVVHDLDGDGIILFRVKDGIIESSAAWHIGMQKTESIGTPNAIWTWMCQDCRVSHNEAFLTDSPGVDGGAFDIDYGNTRNSVLDNYGHDTEGYCIAVFAAGYVTHDSEVRGNLCIDNGQSPRLAQYQGAMFIWTWNDGIIENLRIEKNTFYWDPPGRFPAILNRADIRGAEKVFRGNTIYSASPWMLESNKKMTFENNEYIRCGRDDTKWVFDGRSYKTFDEYRGGSGQERGSHWKTSVFANCLGASQDQAPAGAEKRSWKVISEIPLSLDGHGLLDAAALGQFVVLKNLYRQYQASGLQVTIKLVSNTEAEKSVDNIISDLAMQGIEVLREPSTADANPKTIFVAPDGTVLQEWPSFVGPAEIGLPVRQKLGRPSYSQMSADTL